MSRTASYGPSFDMDCFAPPHTARHLMRAGRQAGRQASRQAGRQAGLDGIRWGLSIPVNALRLYVA